MKHCLAVYLLLHTATTWAQPTILLKEVNVENAYPRLSKDDKQILYQSNKTGKWQLYISDINGQNTGHIHPDKYNNNFPDWSADNKHIAFVSDRDGNEEIYIMQSDGSNLERLTKNKARDIHPYFSPDGKCLLFNSDRDGPQFEVYKYDIASGTTTRLTHTEDNETCARYAPGMQTIVLLKNSETSDGIYLLDTTSSTALELSSTPNVNHGWPVFSHDGKWIYYSSMEEGTYSIYRIRPDGSGKQQITKAAPGEENARVNLSHDGRFMIYNIRSGSTISIVKEDLPR